MTKIEFFNLESLKMLSRPIDRPENGQVTIIGGSDLFHGAPLLALKVASRIVDMVYFSSPEESVGKAALNLKSKLLSFIWVPWDELESYIQKSDAVLIGPGMKRWHNEKDRNKYQTAGILKEYDQAGTETKFITEKFLRQFPNKKWVIDAGSLQVLNPGLIPSNAVITPNTAEFKILFGSQARNLDPLMQDEEKKIIFIAQMAKKYHCNIVLKGPITIVCSQEKCVRVRGGNSGMTKGGTGDVQAGLTVALLARNDPFLAASCSAWIIKKAADNLYKRVGGVYNADDLADEITKVLGKYFF